MWLRLGNGLRGTSNLPCRECGEEGEPIARAERICLNDYTSNELKVVARSEPENNADLVEAV